MSNLLCFLGIHCFADWSYEHDDSCEQRTVCTRCGKIGRTRTEHCFADWSYEHDDSCEQRAACTRCGKIETITEHLFAGWSYVAANSCEQRKVCTRCGQIGRTRTEHRWETFTELRKHVLRKAEPQTRYLFSSDEVSEPYWETGRRCSVCGLEKIITTRPCPADELPEGWR